MLAGMLPEYAHLSEGLHVIDVPSCAVARGLEPSKSMP